MRKFFCAIEKEFGVPDFGKMIITACNDINKETLDALNEQGHEVDAFGIGTHLVTCFSQPALGHTNGGIVDWLHCSIIKLHLIRSLRIDWWNAFTRKTQNHTSDIWLNSSKLGVWRTTLGTFKDCY